MGVANLFMVSEPLLGWRAVRVTERRSGRADCKKIKYVHILI
jgi:hypothetical protein